MEIEVTKPVQCPFCGHQTEIVVDTSTPADDLTVDCERCCRPFEVKLACSPGKVLQVEVDPG